ncbi:MAG: DUF1801 domain-containing protein [Chitinophagaceae bacterium]|nr:DUF1801 domain-containing protein [Chitinophagaceae bacterium]
MAKPVDIDEYISGFPKETQNILMQLRTAIKKAVPEAAEVISYGMPAFKLHGMLVWFAAHTSHTGLYPKASGIEAFKKELAVYKFAKGSIQFPYHTPLPVKLITKIVKFRAAENLQKVTLRNK